MKKEIHPEYHPVLFVDESAKFEFATQSTMTSKETRDINGVKHYVVKLEISSASHPFFTGKQLLVDTAGRVEKFRRKYGDQKTKGTEVKTVKAKPRPKAEAKAPKAPKAKAAPAAPAKAEAAPRPAAEAAPKTGPEEQAGS